MKEYLNITRIAAVMLLSAGYGWAGGHYIPANSNLPAYVFQLVVIGMLLLLGVNFLNIPEAKRAGPNWSTTGLGIFSAISFIINVLNIVYGAMNHDPHAFGSHNTFADLVPI